MFNAFSQVRVTGGWLRDKMLETQACGLLFFFLVLMFVLLFSLFSFYLVDQVLFVDFCVVVFFPLYFIW